MVIVMMASATVSLASMVFLVTFQVVSMIATEMGCATMELVNAILAGLVLIALPRVVQIVVVTEEPVLISLVFAMMVTLALTAQ